MENLLHLKAPGDWINDPNGFIYYKGEYHLFYQYFPCAPQWGTMHWGHATSPDLIHWIHKGIALYPTKNYDKNGVFSGSAIEQDGKLWLYYTAVQYLKENPENIHHADEYLQSQALVISEDGKTFDNLDEKKQVIPAFTGSDIADAKECRDPKVWKENDRWYMCLGTMNRKKNTGVLLIMESKDGLNWKINSRLEDDCFGYTLECPDIFEVDQKQILICSPMGNMANTEYMANQSTMHFAHFDGDSESLSVEQGAKFLDYGMELYAPQSNLDSEERRTVVSWLRTPKPISSEHNTASNGRLWNGMMSLPRVISIRNGEIYTSVHPNVRDFFEKNGKTCSVSQNYVETVYEENHQIKTTLTEGKNIDIKGIIIELFEGQVVLNRSAVIPDDVEIHSKSCSPYVGESCSLEIYFDQDIMEVYINDGQYVITNWIEIES